MRIRFFCHYGQLTGYGRAARDYLAALNRVRREYAGDDLEIVAYEDLLQNVAKLGYRHAACSPEPRYEHLDPLVTPVDQLAPADVEIHHANPRLLAQIAKGETGAALGLGQAIAPARHRIALTTWETSVFPEEYAAAVNTHRKRDGIHGFDRLIVPSRFCATVIDEANPEPPGGPPISVLPHCFDPDFWKMTPAWRERDLRPDLPVRFYTIGAWNERKNQAGILKAYLSAFTAEDKVVLLLACGGVDQNEIRSLLARCGILAGQTPEIQFINASGTMSEDELKEIHGAGDCFVSATRGEGWGLGLFEAAIMGRTIISPDYGGQDDFLQEYPWALYVDYNLTPCFGSETRGDILKAPDGRMMQSSKVSIPPGVNCRQMWAEPDLSGMAAQLRAFYQYQCARVLYPDAMSMMDDAGAGGAIGRSVANLDAVALSFADRYGYAAVGAAFVNLLQEICR